MTERFWRETLSGVEPTRFPDLTGKSPSARKEFLGYGVAEQTLILNEEDSVSFPEATWLAACFKTLTLYLGDTDLSFDYLCRYKSSETESAIEDEATPLRATLDLQAKNGHIVSQLRRALQETNQRKHPPKIVLEELLGSADASLSDVLVILHGSSPHPNSVSSIYHKYSFVFEISNSDSGLPSHIRIHYQRSLLLDEDTHHVFAAFTQALLLIHHNPADPFLSWHSPHSSIRNSTSNTKCEPFKTQCAGLVHSAFEDHAVQRPSDIALDFLDENNKRTRWTYAILNSLGNRIADALISEYGVAVEDSVPICVSKSPAFYASVLGVLKAGASFTPFAGSPHERKKFMLCELASKVVLCTNDQDMSWCDGLSVFDITPILERGIRSKAPYFSRNIPSVSPLNLCYQMYTSGSTGRPKAVSLEHRNAVQTAYAARELVPWKTDSRILQQAGVTFDMCYYEIFLAWNTGICLFSAPDALIYNRLADVINELGISMVGSTPSVALTLDPQNVPSVEWMYCVGEVLPQSLVDNWEGRLVNSYGPTEAAQMVTLFPVCRNVKSTVVGKPFQNTSFIVLGKGSVEVMPILGVGELCIGGFQVAREYFKNPGKTAESFITWQGSRFYRTGDLVRMLTDGTFEFIGRVDDQVKIRGQRVELGEIDRALEASHESIERAVTQILKLSDASKNQLVAFLVPKKETADKVYDKVRDAAQTHLARTLPSYMTPTLFHFIDEVPLSTTGKIDRRKLAELLRTADYTHGSHMEPAQGQPTDAQKLLRQVFSDFSGLPQHEVTLSRSIYQMGLDSISAIQIAQALRRDGFKIQASDIMKQNTIARLAPMLEAEASSSAYGASTESRFDFEAFDRKHRPNILKQFGIASHHVTTIRPASPLQSGMIAQSMHSSGIQYFNHLTHGLPQDFDLQRFIRAWETLMTKHEILRSGFAYLDDARFPVAMITYQIGHFPAPVHDSNISQTRLHEQQLNFCQSTTAQLHHPLWRIFIVNEQNEFHLSAHHALYDARVLEIFVRDLTLAYNGACLPVDEPINEHLAVFLHDNTLEQHDAVTFWRELGAQAVASKFPVLHPLNHDIYDTEVATSMSELSLKTLEQGCRESGISLQAAAQSAWAYLLAMLIGESTVTFGTVYGGRTMENSNEVSFPMITTLPTVVNTALPCSTVVNGLVDFNADAQRYQFSSLKSITKWMDRGDQPLFDTIFTFQKPNKDEPQARPIFPFVANRLTIEYPVSVEVETVGSDRLWVSVYYQSRYMQQEQADLLVRQFHFILMNVIKSFDTALYPNVSEADPQLFSVVPAEQEQLPSECSLLHTMIEMQASKSPDKVALEYITSFNEDKIEKSTWTFEQLNVEGNRIANLLQRRGAQQGQIVAICFEKCPEAAFAMLGILKAGCGFLALDAGAPADRKRFIVQDCGAEILLSKGTLATGLEKSLFVTVVDLGTEEMHQHSGLAPVLDREIDAQEISYCLYTSGTTGTPKGCLLTHENAVQVFLCFEELYAYTETSRWLQFASYHFDVSVMEHFWSWSVGMTVVKADRDLILQDLAAAISRLRITHIDLTPSLARTLEPDDVPTLARGVFVTGGEMLRKDIIEKWGASGAIHNAYGPTEATIGVTMYRHVPRNGRASNIGWPFPVVGIFVVNPRNPTVPVLRGGVGELCIAGKLVAKGYLGRDGLTRERFISLASQKCYRTGDLARILSDGSIEFIGRTDDQVKLRGQRLEVGEINAVIKQHDTNIDDVSTLVIRHPRQRKEQLVSFIALRDTGEKQEDLSLCMSEPVINLLAGIHDTCTRKLPRYMVPTHCLVVNRIPLSPNNKVEIRQLRTLYERTGLDTLQNLSGSDKTLDTNLETDEDLARVVKIFSRTLGMRESDISYKSSFFELGLDSISVINFAKSLKAEGIEAATPSLIMRNASVIQLARVLKNEPPASTKNSVKAATQSMSAFEHRYKNIVATTLRVRPENIEAVAPCTPLQAGIIARALDSGRGLYFASFTFDLAKEMDLEKLHCAFHTLVKKIQILRAVFQPTDDGFAQIIMRDQTLWWMEDFVQDGGDVAKSLKASHERWRKKNQKNISAPLEVVVTQTPTARLLTLHAFHAIYDGNSLDLLLQALTSEYHDLSNFDYGPSFLSVLPYGPLREVEGAKDFWTSHLSDWNLVTGNVQPLASVGAGSNTSVSYRIKSIEGWEESRRKLGVTSQSVAQACWSALLQETMSAPMVMGTVVSGRSIDFEDADKVIGPLFNTLPFLLKLQQDDSWKTVINRCHDFNSTVSPYDHTPLRDIQKWNRKEHSSNPLFQTLFIFRKSHSGGHKQQMPWQLQEESSEADYPLSIEVEQTSNDSFNLTLACQAHISTEEASTALLKKYEQFLKTAIGDVDQLLFETVDMSRIAVDRAVDANDSNGRMDNISNMDGSGPLDPHSLARSFTWSDIAHRVRSEISALAGVSADEITATTSIFEVGLDSIDAVKLSSRLKKVSNVLLPVSQLMRLLTVSKISAAITAKKGDLSEVSTGKFVLKRMTESIERHFHNSDYNLESIEKILPCTPLQESMVADMINSHFERYLNFDVLRLEKGTDTKKLKAAWERVIEQTPILRTRFVEIDNAEIDCTFAQCVVRHPKSVWNNRTTDEDFAQITASIREEIRGRFSRELAFQLTLVKRPECTDARYLILALPHAMYDGSSLEHIHNMVESVYYDVPIEVTPIEPALARVLDGSGEASQSFWQQLLSGMESTLFPIKPTGGVSSHRSEKSSQIPSATIQRFCKKNRITVSALTQVTWAIVLAYYAQRLDVSFAQVLSGRTDQAAESVVFPTMNTIAFRTILHGTRLQMLNYVQDTLTSIQEHQHFPLRKALSSAAGKRASEMFNTLFIYQAASPKASSFHSRLYESTKSVSEVEYSVCVEAEVLKDKLIWRTAGKDNCLDEDGTKILLVQLDQVLSEIMLDPHAPVVNFDGDQVQLCGLEPFTERSRQVVSSRQHPVSSQSDNVWSATERSIRAVIAEVTRLDVTEIRKQSSIFELGLDSISAIKVSSLLRRKGIQIRVDDLLTAESIQKIAEVSSSSKFDEYSTLQENDGANAQTQHDRHAYQMFGPFANVDFDQLLAGSGIDPENIEHILPASPGQVFLLSRWQGQGVYYSTLDFWVHGCNDVRLIKTAWVKLAKQIPMLRTVFLATSQSDYPVAQAVLSTADPRFVEVSPNSTLEEEADRSLTVNDGPPGPPCALFAQKTERDQFHVAFKMSHALYDGFSLALLVERLRDLIDNPDSKANAQQKSFSAYLDKISSNVSKRDFWTGYLSGIQNPPLLKYTRHGTDDRDCNVHVVKANAFQNLSTLTQLIRKRNLAIQPVLIAAHAVNHARILRSSNAPDHEVQDILVGVYLASRNMDGADELIAPTLGFAPLRVRQPLCRSLIDIAQQIQADMREFAKDGNGQVGLWELAEWVGEQVKVDVWINVLRPPPSQTQEAQHASSGNVQVVSGEKSEDVEEEFSLSSNDENVCHGLLLKNNAVRKFYDYPMIDLEITIKDDALDIGVLAPKSMLDSEEAKAIITNLEERLDSILGYDGASGL